MLILPVGLERNEVRRTPWVTWALIGTCFLVHLHPSCSEPWVERMERARPGVKGSC